MKATYKGHCQLCGRLQKLPNGKLALHGYEVRWNQFVGDCPGSRHLPYELSCDMIEAAERSARQHAKTLRAMAAETRSLTDAVWVHEYIPATYTRSSHYVWRKLPLNEVTLGYSTEWVGQNGKRTWTNVYGANTTDEYRQQLNEARAKAFEQDALKTDEYAHFLAVRLAKWEKQPLTIMA